jgi:hypothetical protein
VTEVRTVSKTGGHKGVKPQRHSLIPKDALDVISEVYAWGATKYADHNWRNGYEWSKSYDALIRHLTAWWDNEDNDPESGLSHLGHAGFHVFVLIVFSRHKRYADYDDRYKEEVKCPTSETSRRSRRLRAFFVGRSKRIESGSSA